MLRQIRGLHHVTSMTKDARRNNVFFTGALGLRRVKKTVNFDAPDVYHLYYGDENGAPGTVMTYFAFPDIGARTPGAGEVARTAFSVPQGALDFWRDRFRAEKVSGLTEQESFGERRIDFLGPDGDAFALVEAAHDGRQPWTGGAVPAELAVRGFHSVSLRLAETGPTAELLRFMGYQEAERSAGVQRFVLAGGNGANAIDLEAVPNGRHAGLGAGSVHHVAFAVADRPSQLEVRDALVDAGFQVTPAIDRDYFWAIYFRSPGGVLFEVATGEPGFDRDEDASHLGEALKLPAQHEHLRAKLERSLEPLED